MGSLHDHGLLARLRGAVRLWRYQHPSRDAGVDDWCAERLDGSEHEYMALPAADHAAACESVRLLAEVRAYARRDYPSWPASLSVDLEQRIDAVLAARETKA